MRMEKRKVGILGATGAVGRRCAELLAFHPWFEIGMLVGTSHSAGHDYEAVWTEKETALARHYGEAFWTPRLFPAALRGRMVQSFEELLRADIDIVLSSVPEHAGGLERQLIERGCTVFSNSPHGRFEEANPLVVPEVNGDVIGAQKLIKNPNCVTSGLVLVLAPLRERFGLRHVSVTTYQSLSGRGDAKYPRDVVHGSVLPLHGSDENTESYIKAEVKKILKAPSLPCSVTCNRVFTQEGHYVELKVGTTRPVGSSAEVAELLLRASPPAVANLPSAPPYPLILVNDPGRPRPRSDAWHHYGMAVAVGNLSTQDEVHDLRLSFVVNNLVRGAAGGALLNAEFFLNNALGAMP
jgi:aspartate-semialdehyde dehydrogenase